MKQIKIFGNFISNKGDLIILYCSNGYRSLDAYAKLKKYGYKNVFNLYKGLENY